MRRAGGQATLSGVDVREVLVRARAQAGLDQRRLALAAGTARTTVVAYETGARSPTVRQLTRLLRACGLQARVLLEPLAAELDTVLEQARSAGPPSALTALDALSGSLSAAGVAWALDGASAVAVHGLALPHDVLVDDEVSRLWLRTQWVKAWDSHGFSLAPNWHESGEKVREYTQRPVWMPLGFLQVRFVAALPPVLAVHRGAVVVPVLPLVEVRRAHPWLAELLARHEAQL